MLFLNRLHKIYLKSIMIFSLLLILLNLVIASSVLTYNYSKNKFSGELSLDYRDAIIFDSKNWIYYENNLLINFSQLNTIEKFFIDNGIETDLLILDIAWSPTLGANLLIIVTSAKKISSFATIRNKSNVKGIFLPPEVYFDTLSIGNKSLSLWNNKGTNVITVNYSIAGYFILKKWFKGLIKNLLTDEFIIPIVMSFELYNSSFLKGFNGLINSYTIDYGKGSDQGITFFVRNRLPDNPNNFKDELLDLLNKIGLNVNFDVIIFNLERYYSNIFDHYWVIFFKKMFPLIFFADFGLVISIIILMVRKLSEFGDEIEYLNKIGILVESTRIYIFISIISSLIAYSVISLTFYLQSQFFSIGNLNFLSSLFFLTFDTLILFISWLMSTFKSDSLTFSEFIRSLHNFKNIGLLSSPVIFWFLSILFGFNSFFLTEFLASFSYFITNGYLFFLLLFLSLVLVMILIQKAWSALFKKVDFLLIRSLIRRTPSLIIIALIVSNMLILFSLVSHANGLLVKSAEKRNLSFINDGSYVLAVNISLGDVYEFYNNLKMKVEDCLWVTVTSEENKTIIIYMGDFPKFLERMGYKFEYNNFIFVDFWNDERLIVRVALNNTRFQFEIDENITLIKTIYKPRTILLNSTFLVFIKNGIIKVHLFGSRASYISLLRYLNESNIFYVTIYNIDKDIKPLSLLSTIYDISSLSFFLIGLFLIVFCFNEIYNVYVINISKLQAIGFSLKKIKKVFYLLTLFLFSSLIFSIILIVPYAFYFYIVKGVILPKELFIAPIDLTGASNALPLKVLGLEFFGIFLVVVGNLSFWVIKWGKELS